MNYALKHLNYRVREHTSHSNHFRQQAKEARERADRLDEEARQHDSYAFGFFNALLALTGVCPLEDVDHRHYSEHVVRSIYECMRTQQYNSEPSADPLDSMNDWPPEHFEERKQRAEQLRAALTQLTGDPNWKPS